MADRKPLARKVAVVTGGAKRLGRAAAVALARAGVDVAITYLTSAREASRTVKELKALGVRAIALRCDVRDSSSVHTAVAGVVRQFGRLDVLVNNAGTYETVEFEELTLAQWDSIFAVNVRGPFLMVKEALPHLRRAKGRIVNLGSLGGLRAWSTHVHYSSSKAALHMLTKAMAKALAPEISVNCVAPGMIDLGERGDKTFITRVAKQSPMRRNGSDEDVAAAVLFFATVPKFITGQIMFVDGGLSL
jgi:3-oxoacyl-[acyl-carrier protein] reductase/pteridine reductase